jgi:YD repeat-containing protein
VVRRSENRGATLRAADGEGRTTTYRRGPRGLLSEIEDLQGGRVRIAYDDQERLAQVVNQTGRTWSFVRDAVGRVVEETDFDGLTTAYAYDEAGRLGETRHADGTRAAYAYDRSGLLVREAVHDPGRAAACVTTFGYDASGLLVRAENDDALVLFERDEMGRVVAETVKGRRIESTFDCCGRRVERRIGGRVTEYAYDPVGALVRLTLAGHAPLNFTRNALWRETRRRNGGGFQLDQGWDAVGQLLHQSVASAAPPGPGGGAAGLGVERRYA